MTKPYEIIKWPNGNRFVIGARPDKSVETNVARVYRPYFLVKITGSNAVVPFYISSGSGGKVDGEGNLYGVGRAFPFWGFGDDSWQNKTTHTDDGEDRKYATNTYYGMPLLRRIAEEIDIAWSKHAPKYRNPSLEKTTRQDKIEKKVNGELKRTIGITPLRNTKTALYGPERDQDFLRTNIDVARKSIEVSPTIKRGPSASVTAVIFYKRTSVALNRNIRKSKDHPMLLLEFDGVIVGFAQFRDIGAGISGKPTIMVESLWARSKGKGIGTTLMENLFDAYPNHVFEARLGSAAALNDALKWGLISYQEREQTVVDENATIAFYTKLGFGPREKSDSPLGPMKMVRRMPRRQMTVAPGGSRKPERLDSTFARAARKHEYVYGRDSSGEVNRTMYTWNPVLSTEANHQAAAEAGAPRGPCWCGVYHDIRLDCPNRDMYRLNKNYYIHRGGNNRARVSN